MIYSSCFVSICWFLKNELLQAEESQRLRKKKRAESIRLLDMERRQKQRLEEIRETQKKVKIYVF